MPAARLYSTAQPPLELASTHAKPTRTTHHTPVISRLPQHTPNGHAIPSVHDLISLPCPSSADVVRIPPERLGLVAACSPAPTAPPVIPTHFARTQIALLAGTVRPCLVLHYLWLGVDCVFCVV